MTQYYFASLILGALLALCVWLLFRERRTQARQMTLLEEAQKVRGIARCQAIEEELQAWLTMLELPSLAEQTRLAAAARQLRIVLVERLVNGPRLR